MIVELSKQIKCKRCFYEWNPRKAEVRMCPKCKSPWFDTEKKKKGEEK